MATRLDNIRLLSNGDDMGDVNIEDVIAQVVAPIQPTPIQAIATTSEIPKTTKQIIKSMVDSGAFASGQAVLVNGTYYQPVYASSGSGQDYQQGPLENVITYKESDNKVGGNVNWYSPSGEFQQLSQQQEVDATKDFMQFAAMAGGLFGAPLAIGQSLGLTGATASAVGQGLLTTGTQLGSGANLGDALMSGLKTGAVPIANAALSQIPQFAALSAPVQATVASAVGNIVANGGELTPAVLLSAIGAGLNAANQPNITALEGLTNSGRIGDDMGGGYDTTISQNTTLPSGVQVASLGETPFRLESGGVPLYAESSGASAIRPPAGYEVMSASLADNKPSGAYYDATANAWLTPTNQFSNVTNSNQIASDANLFNANVNTIDSNAIKNIINQSTNEITLDDITRIIGGQNFARPEDIQSAINSINIPQGLTEQNVQSIVSNALATNPSLTTDQVSQIVNNAVSNIPTGLTASDVTNIISSQKFATPQDIQTAINSINIPQGLSSTDVQSIVSSALASNPSLTANDVQSIVNSAVSKIPTGLTASDVTSIIGKQNFATPQDIQTAVNSIKIPQGLSEQDVKSIVSNAFASNPSLTSTQVSQIVNSAISQIPSGLTASDVQSIVGSAVSQLPVAPTTQDIINIIGGQGLASTSQLTQQGRDLMAALQQQGVDYNTALTQALKSQSSSFTSALGATQSNIDALAQSLGKTKEGLLSELNMTEADLTKQISGVQSLLGQQITNLSQQTQQQLAQQSTQTQQQFNSLTDAQKAQADALVKQGVSLNQAIAQSQSQTQSQIANLSQQTQQQLAQQTVQTQAQFQGLSDAQKAQADALVNQGTTLSSAINQVQAGLGTQISDLSQQTQSQLAQQSAQTQQQFNSLTAAQKAQADALVSQGATFNTALNQVQTGLGQQIGNVQSSLEAQLDAQGKQFLDQLQQRGVDYQTALNEALAQQSATYKTSLGDVINQIGGVQTGLESQITNVQANLESQLDAQGKQYLETLQQRGVDYQTALDEAIAQQNAKIGEVQTSFEEQFKNASAASADNFAKVMLSLAAIQDANTPKTFSYDVADPSTWASPVYNQATGPVTPITPLDFGNREMLRGTQWEKFLDPNYGQVPAPVQFNQPTNMGYDQLMNILGTGRDTLPSQALTINDVISGIQNQYGQTPAGSMGQKPA